MTPENSSPTPPADARNHSVTPDGPTWNPDSSLPPSSSARDGLAFRSTSLAEPHAPRRGHAVFVSPHLPEPGTLLQGERYQYRLRHPLGSGGMGAVYLAETLPGNASPTDSDTSSDVAGRPHPPAEVAVKFFKAPEGSDPGVMLKRELSAVRALRHDRIPCVYDWSTRPPLFFAVFPYYSGGSLADEIGRLSWLEPAQAWRLLEDLLSALAAAHRACILHLDVKPGNVLCNGAGNYLLSDFGISQGRLVSRSMVSTGLGAPVFQSPEQRRCDHESFDARTDLWGVGITVWTALTGASAADLRDLRSACESGTHGLPPPSSFRPGIPARIEKLLMPLLATSPEHRPGAAAEVLAAVRDLRVGRTESPAAPALSPADSAARRALYDSLMDPLWRALFRGGSLDSHVVCYRQGEVLCHEGDERFETWVLLRGTVNIERDGHLLASESREGTFLGEVTALTGTRRTATMVAHDEVWAVAFNPAELERFVTRHPAVAIRLIKVLADRVQRESQRPGGRSVVPASPVTPHPRKEAVP